MNSRPLSALVLVLMIASLSSLLIQCQSSSSFQCLNWCNKIKYCQSWCLSTVWCFLVKSTLELGYPCYGYGYQICNEYGYGYVYLCYDYLCYLLVTLYLPGFVMCLYKSLGTLTILVCLWITTEV